MAVEARMTDGRMPDFRTTLMARKHLQLTSSGTFLKTHTPAGLLYNFRRHIVYLRANLRGEANDWLLI